MASRPVSDAASALAALAERWKHSALKERQAFQPWFIDFCAALGVDPPPPDGQHSYCFEKTIVVQGNDERDTTNFIDCWKAGHVAIEAKATGQVNNDIAMRRAFRQLKAYVAAEPGTIPPYLMVVDVPRELILWDRWSGAFGDFAAGRRIPLESLYQRPDDIALLRDVFTQPQARDPRGKAQQVSREIAGRLAELAATFEDRGHEPERVARFLMRCVFCCFAEDVGLLPKKLFERTLETARDTGDSAHVAMVLTELWQKMDTGGMFGADRIARFNGHFFKTVESLALQSSDVLLLIEAARFDWAKVEPSIFGTLLVRALDKTERHRLGAEYTPREYIERLVDPTVVEPIRERWSAVQAHMAQLEQGAKKKGLKQAEQEVREFHAWLRGLKFLDPACGSGNFLYVTMAAVKRIELEVIRELERLRGREGIEQTEQILDEVHPRQFYGIEVNWWAREIAELTLWIGYHQFWREAHGGRTPPIPILEDTGTIECRDAILAWDSIVHRPEKDRPDPTPRIVHPVTGELVPDPNAKLPYYEYVGARQAEWPQADFIVGNPPYLGNQKMRESLGSGYTDAVRRVYPDVADKVDYVGYWWRQAASWISSQTTVRAGLITTNSIAQQSHWELFRTMAASGARVRWAISDHPWVDPDIGAAVRVAMTVLSSPPSRVRVLRVSDAGEVIAENTGPTMNPDLTVGTDITTAAGIALRASRGISHRGVVLLGSGFVLSSTEAASLRADSTSADVVKPLRNGRDLMQRPRNAWVIDFGTVTEAEARLHARAYDLVRARVKPIRDADARESRRKRWWQFGEPQPALREASSNLSRVIVTPMTARHRVFSMVSARACCDQGLIVIAVDDPWLLGVLSSSQHEAWARATGSRLGVGNDFRYTNNHCFDAFPFPTPDIALRQEMAELGERLDAHRVSAIGRGPLVTMTGMYNVVEKLRTNQPLTPKERAIHEVAACGVLKDLHDELNALVAEAYGWAWPMEREEILERLVALHDERVEEEKRGLIRWLRPDYQIPRFAPDHVSTELDLVDGPTAFASAAADRLPWPTTAVEQLAAVSALIARRMVTVDEAVAAFDGAERKIVARHLETLAMLGEVRVDHGTYGPRQGVA